MDVPPSAVNQLSPTSKVLLLPLSHPKVGNGVGSGVGTAVGSGVGPGEDVGSGVGADESVGSGVGTWDGTASTRSIGGTIRRYCGCI